MLASSSSLRTVSSCPRLLILPLDLSSHAGLLICPVCCPPLHWTPCPPARYHFHTGLLIFPPPCPLLHWLSFPPCSLATPSLTFQIIPHSCLVFLAYPSLWIPAPCPPCPTFTLAPFSLPLLLTLHPCADFLFLSTHHPPLPLFFLPSGFGSLPCILNACSGDIKSTSCINLSVTEGGSGSQRPRPRVLLKAPTLAEMEEMNTSEVRE